jgi:hypothetical protein
MRRADAKLLRSWLQTRLSDVPWLPATDRRVIVDTCKYRLGIMEFLCGELLRVTTNRALEGDLTYHLQFIDRFSVSHAGGNTDSQRQLADRIVGGHTD